MWLPGLFAPARRAEVVSFDRMLLGRTVLLALILCWPLMLFGRPAYFPDTLGYYTGGAKAVAFAVHKLEPATSPSSARGQPTAAPVRSDVTKEARSIAYSVLAWLLGGSDLSLKPLAVVQALLVAFTATIFLHAAQIGAARYWATALLVALATPAAWVASFAMPDIFAGVAIAIIATMSVCARRLSLPVAVSLCLIGALTICAHTSHVAIALLLAPLGLAWIAFRQWRERRRLQRGAWLWAAAPVVLGMAAVLIGGLVGFGEISLAPKHIPLTLARSVGDGPGRWYLEQRCATEHYTVCDLYGRNIPKTSNDFLWGPNGINHKATPTQMEQLRREEPKIVLGAAAAYPWQQLQASLGGVVRQLVNFGVDEEDFSLRIVRRADGDLAFEKDSKPPIALAGAADMLSRLSAGLALVWLLLGLAAATPERRAMALFILAGLVANAAVCAILSGASDRYQARVIWLLPLAAAVLPAPFRRLARVEKAAVD